MRVNRVMERDCVLVRYICDLICYDLDIELSFYMGLIEMLGM